MSFISHEVLSKINTKMCLALTKCVVYSDYTTQNCMYYM